MSDKPEGTEPATEHRRQQLRRDGDVPVSRQTATAGAIMAFLLFIAFGAPMVGRDLSVALRMQLSLPSLAGDLSARSELGNLLQQAGRSLIFWLIAIGMGASLIAFLGASAVFSSKRLEFKPDRLNPVAGLGRMFGKEVFVNALRSILVAIGLIIVAIGSVYADLPRLINLPYNTPKGIIAEADHILLTLLGAVAFLTICLALLDQIMTRMQYEKRIMMTRDEVKRENKDEEGDPQIKMRRRRMHRDLMQGAIQKVVPEAAAVIANPTHVAIAIRYKQGVDAAPIVVAKGVDAVALRIRSIASANDVPVIENRPLARAMLKTVKIGQPIPSRFFRAVAEVLAFVYQQRQLREQKLLRRQQSLQQATRRRLARAAQAGGA